MLKKKNPLRCHIETDPSVKADVRMMSIPEGEERTKKGSLFKEVIAENFPNLVKELDTQIYEASRIPS